MKDLQALANEVAGREVDCGETYHGMVYLPDEKHSMSCVCKGTGKVPKFPMLRKDCPDENCGDGILLNDDLPFGRSGDAHKFCGGRGWLPVDDLEALLDAIESKL